MKGVWGRAFLPAQLNRKIHSTGKIGKGAGKRKKNQEGKSRTANTSYISGKKKIGDRGRGV